MNVAAVEPHVVCVQELQPKPLHWLLPGRIPAGKLMLIEGDPDQGKSLLTIDLAARLTTGREMPDGYTPPAPLSVLLISAEDAIQDTILPRLHSAGADCGRVHSFRGAAKGGEHPWPVFPEQCALLRETIADTKAGMVFIDPLTAFLSAGIHTANDAMIRRALRALAEVADDTGAAILLVRHLAKQGGGRRAIYRGAGSIAFIAAVRMATLVAPDPDDPDVRVWAWVKSNLAPPPSSLSFRIVADPPGQPRLEWTGPLDLTADELHGFQRPRRAEALDRAMEFLKDTLRLGPLPQNEIARRAREAGISERTLVRAKPKCHVLSQLVRRGGKQKWMWYFKEHADRCDEAPETRALREAEEERDQFLASLHGAKKLTTENAESTE